MRKQTTLYVATVLINGSKDPKYVYVAADSFDIARELIVADEIKGIQAAGPLYYKADENNSNC
jgi:hypothetical protein